MEQMNVVPIKRCMDVPTKLRELADKIKADEVNGPTIRVTLIIGQDVHCWGPVADDKAAEGAVFDMTFGIHKLMGLPVKVSLSEDGF